MKGCKREIKKVAKENQTIQANLNKFEIFEIDTNGCDERKKSKCSVN